MVEIKEEEVEVEEVILKYKCELCGKCFMTDRGLGIHRGWMHKDQTRQKRDFENDAIKRVNSVSSSPPTKKSKEDHVDDTNHDSALRKKNDEIAELKKHHNTLERTT